ncbi:hypothetical protein Btru_046179 [Bulinus truncatus]|nr:hypothetical protein Btru_046179 [Bulinus truncatus]
MVEPNPMTSSTEALNSSVLDKLLTLSYEKRLEIIGHLREQGYSDDDLQGLIGQPTHKEDTYEDFAEYKIHKLVLLYVPPFLLIFGTLGNLFRYVTIHLRIDEFVVAVELMHMLLVLN